MNEINIRRTIQEPIIGKLFQKGKIITLYGARQVGKTTLAKQILADYKAEDGYFNCEESVVSEALLSLSSSKMYSLFGEHKIIVLDEAQTVKNIGRSLKILIDAYPELNIIATGSSSFELASKVNEPMTGRQYKFILFPLSLQELKDTFGSRYIIENEEQLLLFGSYPEIVLENSEKQKFVKLNNLSTSYLYKDIFSFSKIRNSHVIQNLLRALAFQTGSEVSYNELSSLLKIDKNTVGSYISILEQAFIVYSVNSFSRNMRNEIKKGKKIYFYDNGIVNTLTTNFSPITSGREIGGIWENFIMSERSKYNNNKELFKNIYFWRKNKGGEIDLIEENNGKLYPFEIKYKKEKYSKSANSFVENYNSENINIINKHNYIKWLVNSQT